jgi:WD40 repeat protein
MKFHNSTIMLCALLSGVILALYDGLPTSAQTVLLPDNQPRTVAWSPDGKHIAVGYQNGRIEVISLMSPSTVMVLQDSANGFITALDWSPDGQMLASGTASYDNRLTIWDINTGAPVITDNTFGIDILEVQWSLDGTHVLATSAEPQSLPFNSILVNVLSKDTQGLSLGTVSSAQWSPDGAKIALSHVSRVFIFDIDSMTIVADYPIEQTTFRSRLQNQALEVIWHPNGTELAIGMTDGRILILSHKTPNELALVTTLIAHDYNGDDRLLGFVYALSFTNDGNRLTSISGDGTVRTWDTSTWQVIDEVTTAPNYGAAFTVYGGRAAVTTTLDAMQSSPDVDSAFTQSSIANGLVQIIVAAPSLDRLNAIAELCVRDAAIPTRAVSELARPLTSIEALPHFIAQVESLPDGAIPPACAADLLAIASALIEN